MREADPALRDAENVPLPLLDEPSPSSPTRASGSRRRYRRAVDEYVEAEVLPYVPDAWVDHAKTKLGYEIPLTRHFYRYSHRGRSRRSTPKSLKSRARSGHA